MNIDFFNTYELASYFLLRKCILKALILCLT